MFFTLLLISLTTVTFLLWRRFTFWSRQGVKGPNYLDITILTTEHNKYIMDCFHKYGRVYGIYGITSKNLIINDPELIKEVCVKAFNVFPHHQHINVGQSPKVNKMLFFVRDHEDWKRIRGIASPAFNSGKLRAMMSQLSYISDNFVNNLRKLEKKGEPVNMRDYTGAYAMDVISACAYGIEVNSINNPDHPVVRNAKKFFNTNANLSQSLSIFAPKIASLLKLDFFDMSAAIYFDDLTQKIVEERKRTRTYSDQGNKRTDFIQLMVDQQKTGKDMGYDSNSDDNTEDPKQNQKPTKQSGTLDHDELTAQSINFLIGGYDTTAASLSHLVYYLAESKECQQILYEELKDVEDFSYENLRKLKYLNAVIDETVRLAPALLRITRHCEQDYVLRGIKIPKGTTVDVLPYALHRDPEYWPDPLSFKPDRFLEPKHHPWTYLPFGGGPRLCVGQMFALNEMRMCCAKLFKNFEFSPGPGFKLEYFTGNIMLSPKSVMVNIKSR